MAKFLKDILSEVAEPKSGDEKRFKEKHVVNVTPYPVNGTDEVVTAKKAKKDKSKITHMSSEEEEGMYEETDLNNAFDVVADILANDQNDVTSAVIDVVESNENVIYVLDNGDAVELTVEEASAIANVLELLDEENSNLFLELLVKDTETFNRMVEFALNETGN